MCFLAVGAVGEGTVGRAFPSRRMGRIPESLSREQLEPPCFFGLEVDVDSACGYK